MTGKKHKQHTEDSKYVVMKSMEWNINGWKGDDKHKYRKIRRIKGEVIKYDQFILTETHLSDDEKEIAAFEQHFSEYYIYHVHAKEDSGRRLGVSIGIRKTMIEEKDIEIHREKQGEGGRWIRMRLKGILEEPLDTWGIYAPANTAKYRKEWLTTVGKTMKKTDGAIRVIAGDFNFIMDTKLDKIAGNKNKGMEGKAQQRIWESELEIHDAWREANPDTVATTWEQRGCKKGERKVKTRIDRVLIDEKLRDRVTELRIDKTKVSDHNIITWNLETKQKKNKQPYQRLPVEMLESEEYEKEVKRIFEEERSQGLEGYERFKKRCVEKAVELKRKQKKKKRRDMYKLNKHITLMRRILNWAEDAAIQVERGKAIKRLKRGEQMIRESNPKRWMGKSINEIEDMNELHEKATEQLDKLLDERNENNEKKRRVEKNLNRLKEIDEEDRATSGFFGKMKVAHKKEEIYALIEEQINKLSKEKEDVERRDPKDLQRVATEFYKELWGKRRISRRSLTGLLGQVTRKISDASREDCEKDITMEELKKVVKMMRKGKSPGLDGIPAEFYQKFEFAAEWLHEVYKEILDTGLMTETMRTSIVKLLFKKNDRKRIGNYRPISLLCSDYKILAKIVTERMKKVLTQLIGVEQQGFVEEGDIAGNLLLVKEMIEYCNEEDIEGSMIMMDFMKAYDRIDRGAMMETLKTMGFGDKIIGTVKVLYAQSIARLVMNGEMGEIFETKGGVRQGCPLSPYLFIIVLELMAIAMRESAEIDGIKTKSEDAANRGPEQEQDKDKNEIKFSITSHSHIQDQKDSKDDRISMFADDSATAVGKSEQIVEAREIIRTYEKATGSKLHEGKTMVYRMGPTRNEKMTNKSIGVKFKIMEDEDSEAYLGDVIGNQVGEKTRFEPILSKVGKLADAWNKENIGIFGRSVVANTLMLAKIKHRADVNALSQTMKKKILEEFKTFVWKGKGKRARVKWQVMVREPKKGGIGIKDPICELDASKIRMLIRLLTRNRQPWMKWIERKLIRVAKRWEVPEAMAAKPTKKQIKELRESCIVESTLKTWIEIGGTWKEPKGEQKEEEQKDKEEKKTVTGFGVEHAKEWTPIEQLKTKLVYAILIEKRMKLKGYSPRKAHESIDGIQKKLTANERDYWWRMTHGLISVRKIESKWKKMENGEPVGSKCPMCDETEDREHYEYGCKDSEELRKRVAIRAGRQPPLISREEWALEVEVEEDMKMMIATARWIYHCERCKIDLGKRRRMNIKIVMQKLDRRLETAEEAKKKKEEVNKKRKEAANKRKEQANKQKEQLIIII